MPMRKVTQPRPYERGTPRGPISTKARTVIICLILACSTWFTTLILNDELRTIFMSLAGAFACILGLLYDSTVYSYAWIFIIFSSSLLENTNNNSISNILFAGKSCLPLTFSLILTNMAKRLSFPFRELFASLITPVFMSAVFIPPLIAFLVGLAILYLKGNEVPLGMWLSGLIGVSFVLLLWGWHRNRSHKFSCLLDRGEIGLSFLTTIALCASVEERIFPSLLASSIATLSCTAFGATADVWYTVSTGQFWMCTLDIATGALYILLPLVLLGSRFREMYGLNICNKLRVLGQDLLPSDDDKYYDELLPLPLEEMTSLALIQILTLSFTTGVALTRALCPFGAHLYSRVYLHGQPNTKMIALCLIIDDWTQSGEKLLLELASLKNNLIFLNFIITKNDLQQQASSIKRAKDAGHTIIPYTNDQGAHEEFVSLFSQEPEWSHGNSYPSDLISCSERDTKIVLWSHYYSNNNSNKPCVTQVKETCGGSIVCLKEQPVVVILDFTKKLIDEGYTVAPLSKVAKEDPPMLLSTSVPSSSQTMESSSSNNTTTVPLQNKSE